MSKKMKAIKRKQFEALRQRYIDEWGYHSVTAEKLAYEVVYGD